MSDTNAEDRSDRSVDESDRLAAAAPGRSRTESAGGIARDPTVRAYVGAIATLYAVVGVGIGATILLTDAVGRDFLEVGTGGGDGLVEISFPEYDVGLEALAETALTVPPFVALVLGVVVGGSLALRADGRRAAVAGGLGTLVGTVLLWVPAAYLSWSVVDADGLVVGIDAIGLVANAVVVGLVVGVATACTTYVVRTLVPDAAPA